MAIKFKVTQNGKLVIEKFADQLTIEELIDHIYQLSTRDDVQPDAVNIADFRGTPLPVFSAQDIGLLVQARSAKVPHNRISKLALLVDDVVGYDLITQYEKLMKQAGVNVMVSSSMATVCRFMNLDQVTIEAELLRL